LCDLRCRAAALAVTFGPLPEGRMTLAIRARWAYGDGGKGRPIAAASSAFSTRWSEVLGLDAAEEKAAIVRQRPALRYTLG